MSNPRTRKLRLLSPIAASMLGAFTPFGASLVSMAGEKPGVTEGASAASAPGTAQTNTVRGQVVFEKSTRMKAKELENVVVWIELTDLAPQELAAMTASMPVATCNQQDMQFIPHVLAAAVGQAVEFPNNDSMFHGVQSRTGPKPFDLGIYGPGETQRLVFESPGVAQLRCSVHSEMEGYIIVVPTPFFAAPERGGGFRFENIPDRAFTVHAWHPRVEAGELSAIVEGNVSDGFTVTFQNQSK